MESKHEEKTETNHDQQSESKVTESKTEKAANVNIHSNFDAFDAEVVSRLRKKVRNAFEMFDKDKREVINQEEVSTIMRYLGQYPCERDVVMKVLPEMLGETPYGVQFEGTLDQDDDEIEKTIPYTNFEECMIMYMLENVFNPDGEDVLLSAFKTLDPERKGYIEEDYMKQAMCKMGSPFRESEYDSFLTAIKDPETGRLYYHEYVANLVTQVGEHLQKVEKSI